MAGKSSKPEATTIFDFASRQTGSKLLDKEKFWLWRCYSSDPLHSAQTAPKQPENALPGLPAISGGLWYLAMSKSGSVRQFVAMNPQAPADCLAFLGKDSTPLVRHFVSCNPSTPPKVLDDL